MVTCRFEKYRNLTKKWLTHHGVKYDKLYMLDLPNKKARLAANCHAKHKARIYKGLGASFFIESSLGQAVDIAKFSGKQVLCMETGEMITPGNAAAILQSTVSLPKKLRRKLPKSLRSRLKAWVGGTKPAQ